MKKQYTILIVLLVFFWFDFFSFKPIVENHFFIQLKIIINLLLLGYTFQNWINPHGKSPITTSIKYLLYLYIFSIAIAYIFNNQPPLRSLSGTTVFLSIGLYFLFQKWNIPVKNIEKIFLYTLLGYTLAYTIASVTFPTNLFGYTGVDSVESMESVQESRGVMRFGIMGAEIVVLMIFFLITTYSKNKKYYIWLIPLFILLFLRGTRGPFFITVAITITYLFVKSKQKILLLPIICTILLSMNVIVDYILSKDSAFSSFIELTIKQVEANKDDEDIRIKMTKFFVNDYNTNIGQIIFGNGVPVSVSSYGKELQSLEDKYGYYPVDVGYVMFFVYFGLLGLYVYLLLLYRVLKIKIPQQYSYTKIYIIYIYIVSIAGAYFTAASPLIAMVLYIMDKKRLQNIKSA
ncbi:hypothetical protein [uncultured Alistipes sp.]|uniref:hypothetical protein n=1 Tax=uncultured Alistipes sp. TaxID=538949 RepID=UPI0025D31698|nr:hypothetical protein [uncultured Alistipes sp.]